MLTLTSVAAHVLSKLSSDNDHYNFMLEFLIAEQQMVIPFARDDLYQDYSF